MTGKYVVRTDAASTPTGDYIVSSWLTVNTVDAFDAGKVVCSVMADDDELPTDLQRVQTTAQLAVIGEYYYQFAVVIALIEHSLIHK